MTGSQGSSERAEKDVPMEWEIVRLEDIAEVGSGGNAPQGGRYFSEGEYPFVRVQHVKGSSHHLKSWDLINDDAVTEYGLHRFPKGSIVFPKSGASIMLEKRAILPVDSYVVGHLCVLTPRKGRVDNVFLLHLIDATKFSRDASGSTLPYLNISEIKKRRILIPPLPEQQKIASILSTVDDAIQRTDEIIAESQQLRKGLMQQLLTKGIGHTKFKKTEIGDIPEEWDLVSLGQCMRGSPQNGVYKHQSYYGRGVPIVRIDDFYEGHFLRSSGFKRVELSDDEISKYCLEAGDILVNRVNSLPFLGKAAIVLTLAEPTAFESNMMRFVTNQDIMLPEYAIRWLCSSHAKSHFRKRAKRAVAQASVNQKDLCSLSTTRPPLDEQREVAGMLASVDDKVAKELVCKSGFDRLMRGLTQVLLTGKVRVKVT